jgi:hypothetical protein
VATPETFDVQIGDDGDLPVRTRHVSGFDLVVQRVARRLRTVRGEWLADKDVGLPYFAWFEQKPPAVESIGAVIRKEIETAPGVIRVEDWSGGFDRDTRTLTYGGTIRTRDGDASLTVRPFGDPRTGNRGPHLRLVIRHRRIAPSA